MLGNKAHIRWLPEPAWLKTPHVPQEILSLTWLHRFNFRVPSRDVPVSRAIAPRNFKAVASYEVFIVHYNSSESRCKLTNQGDHFYLRNVAR